jgi:hypothetical protein
MNRLNQNFVRLINFIKPPRTFSWQTLILVSILLWILALLFGYVGNNLTLHNFFSFLGCALVITGFAAFSLENPIIVQGFSLSAWIWGLSLCLFVASLNPKLAGFAWMIWPVLSAIFATWPELLAVKRKVKNLSSEKRLRLLIWLLCHLVVSCWIQFSLIIQNWVLQYPSLLADNLSQSNYVVKIQPFSLPNTGGELVLEAMERQITAQINGKPWAEVEAWLNDPIKVKKLEDEAKKQIERVKEKDMWKFSTKVSRQKTGYNLLIIAEWQGPSYNSEGYLLKKLCQANSVNQQPTSTNTNRRQVTRREVSALSRTNNRTKAPTAQVIPTVNTLKVAAVQCQAVTQEIVKPTQPQNTPSI